MKKQFINLNGLRVKTSSIKKYRSLNDLEVAVYFTPSVSVYETETIEFENKKERDEFITNLDFIFESSFITINDNRIKLSTISKYKPLNESKFVLYYNTSKKAPLNEVFEFKANEGREEILLLIDIKMGVV